MPDAVPPLLAWENFYVIVGSSAGALTGLMFVVITLSAEARAQSSEISAFGTPTVVHFSTALLVSAILCAPWPVLSYAAMALAGVGVAGIGYVTVVVRRARRSRYRPVPEDWVWHVVLPLGGYLMLAVAAACLPASPNAASFAIAGAALLLLFTAIHNAWDAVTYIALERLPHEAGRASSAPTGSESAKNCASGMKDESHAAP